MGGGLENRCVGHVYGADGAVARHLPQFIFYVSVGTWLHTDTHI